MTRYIRLSKQNLHHLASSNVSLFAVTLIKQYPVSSEISDLLLFLSYFASQNKEIKSDN